MKPKAHQRVVEDDSMISSQARDGKRFGRLASRMTITGTVALLTVSHRDSA